MKNILAILLIILVSGNAVTFAQTNFKTELKEANPVVPNSTFSNEEKVKVHLACLEKAIHSKSMPQHFYCLLYLYVDYFEMHDYVVAAKYLLQAEGMANSSGKYSWQAAICMKKGALTDVLNQDYIITINHYKMAFKLYSKANDSLGIGESLEQIGSMYSYNVMYDSAHYYYKIALPFLEKFASKEQMALTYNNYSNLRSFEKQYSESIRYVDKAISIVRANNDLYKEMMYLNNKGSYLSDLGQYDNAIQIYQNCVVLNKKNNWADHLQQNYKGLFEAYEKKEDYHSAFNYLKTLYLLKDSLMKIADLNVKSATQQNELSLKKNQLLLSQAKHLLKNRTLGLIIIIIVVGIGIILWLLNSRKKRNQLKQNRGNLFELTQILIGKNALIIELESKVNETEDSKQQQQDRTNIETSLFDKRILTNEDWSAFKSLFEKSYPGYLQRIRSVHPSISEAEERLFLFIKLKLNNKETASILGISSESVKKARNRLRKRLQLSEVVNLDTYIFGF